MAPLPPGPNGHLLLGHVPAFLRDRTEFLSRCARDYGDVVPLRFGPRRAVLVSRPDLIEDILVVRHELFTKTYALRLDRVSFDNAEPGAPFAANRHSVAPALTRQRVAAYADAMVACTERRLATWRDGERRELDAEMATLTLDVLVNTLFATDIADADGEVAAALEQLMDGFFARLRTLFLVPHRLPTPGNRRRQRAIRRLDAFINRAIKARREAGPAGDDLLSLLIRRHDADGDPTGAALRNDALTFLLAGHETTALALTWAWHLVGEHPDAEAKLLAEVDAVLEGRPPTAENRPLLEYTQRVVTEAMRLYPPLWAIARVATQTCSVGGYRVPAGTIVLMSPWVVHRDPRHFDRPEVFDPDRWANGLARQLPRYAYFPFGGGPRVCPGSGYAMTEAVLLLATIAQRFRLEPVPGHRVTPRASITLRPASGVPVVLRRR